MPIFKNVTTDDIEFYLKRNDLPVETINVGKEFTTHSGSAAPQRYVYKQIEGKEELEVVVFEDELVLSSSAKGRDQLKVTVFGSNGKDRAFVVQKYRYSKPVKGKSISFLDSEWNEILTFLEKIKFADFSDPRRFQVNQNSIVVDDVVSVEDRELLDQINSLEGSDRDSFLERLNAAHAFSNEDINIISGRRAGLDEFTEHLYGNTKWGEKNWQIFFEKNPWIFGHGLDYRFLSQLHREAAVSDVELNQSDTVKTDFLMGATDFTVLVEIKEPETPLLRGTTKIRSRTWGISTELMDANCQILTQKAEWLVASRVGSNFDDSGNEFKQKAIDSKAILIVGMRSSLQGTNHEMQTKLNTFELFRRDSRNIEIITYDELYDRAFYIVNQRLPVDDDRAHKQH